MNAPGKAVILGGTGVFGSRLARMLLTDGWEVVITSRSASKGQLLPRNMAVNAGCGNGAIRLRPC